MTADIWMPLYTGAYLRDTIGLTDEQHGRYLLCLMAYWKKHGPLSEVEYRAIMKSDSDMLLCRFFLKDGDLWRNERADRELEIADKQKQAVITNSRKGVEARRRSAATKGEPKVDQGLNQRSTPSPSPSPSPEEGNKKGDERFPEVPPMPEQKFYTMADMRGITRECAEWFWNDWESRGWRDKHGQPIRKIEPLLINFATQWRQNHHAGATRSGNGSFDPLEDNRPPGPVQLYWGWQEQNWTRMQRGEKPLTIQQWEFGYGVPELPAKFYDLIAKWGDSNRVPKGKATRITRPAA